LPAVSTWQAPLRQLEKFSRRVTRPGNGIRSLRIRRPGVDENDFQDVLIGILSSRDDVFFV
jgi:hypothetical protein